MHSLLSDTGSLSSVGLPKIYYLVPYVVCTLSISFCTTEYHSLASCLPGHQGNGKISANRYWLQGIRIALRTATRQRIKEDTEATEK